MCGLFGWHWGTEITTAERVVIATTLAREMDDRGSQSWGAWSPDVETFCVKDVGSILDGPNAMRLAQFDRMAVHTRFATHGDVTTDNAHPFRAGGIIGAHNGCIWNNTALDVKYPARNFDVDSMHLIAHLAEGKPTSELTGYGAVVWSDAADPGAFYVGRFCGGELSVAIVLGADNAPAGIVWASTKLALIQALNGAGVRYSVLQTKEGMVYRIDGRRMAKTLLRLSIKERVLPVVTTSNKAFVEKEATANQAAIEWLREEAHDYAGRWAKHDGTMRNGKRYGKVLRDGYRTLSASCESWCDACEAPLRMAKEVREGFCLSCIDEGETKRYAG